MSQGNTVQRAYAHMNGRAAAEVFFGVVCVVLAISAFFSGRSLGPLNAGAVAIIGGFLGVVLIVKGSLRWRSSYRKTPGRKH